MIGLPENAIRIPFGAWHDETEMMLRFPQSWDVRNLMPFDNDRISDRDVKCAFDSPIGTSTLRELSKGKNSAVIAVDDITRPTPTDRILPYIIDQLADGGIESSKITILIGSGAHRPMSTDEIERKLSLGVVNSCNVIRHDFMGADIQKVGCVKGGPVYVNRHFLKADLRICVGSVIPHNETGFGGGAKMIVPGISGHLTITHFHGALPPRLSGTLEVESGIQDRRTWAEQVARHIGVHATVCAVVNSKRELAALFVGDIVEAHRAAAKLALKVGRTKISRSLADNASIIIVNSYPLDSDPIQMGRAISVCKKIPGKLPIVITAASDGIFYHGMGMGCGIDIKRLFKNVPSWIINPGKVYSWFRSCVHTINSPQLLARLCYFTLNNQPYRSFMATHEKMNMTRQGRMVENPNMMVFSPNCPAWGLARRYPKASLYRDWSYLIEDIVSQHRAPQNVLVFPCAPLQILEMED